jgi:dTDP-4-dehydrorhamnose reductase
MKVLLTGASGQLGKCIQDRRPGDIKLVTYNYKQLDITDRQAVFEAVDCNKPDVIINSAAYTAVDKAEADKDKAYLVNHIGSRNLAEAACEINIPLIHISTDYVFDGKSRKPYKPNDLPNPQSIYGKSKLAGEKAIQSVFQNYIIIRTSWVFSEHGNNFVKTILRQASKKSELSVVADQFGCPTYAGDIAEALFSITKSINAGETSRGIYHFCGNEETSWYDYAKEILALAQKKGRLPHSVKIKPIQTNEYLLPAPRPNYSALNCESLKAFMNNYSSHWRDSLRMILDRTRP